MLVSPCECDFKKSDAVDEDTVAGFSCLLLYCLSSTAHAYGGPQCAESDRRVVLVPEVISLL